MFKTDASQRWLLYFIVVTILALYQSYFIIGLVPVLFYAWKSAGYKIWHTKTDVSLVIIFIFETVSIFFSEYKYNTIFESSKICAGLLFYLCIRHFLKYKNAELILSFTLISSLVSLLSILSFLNSRNILLGVGLRNINQFKNLFHPLGQFSNEFVTVELGFVCLLLLFFKNIVYVPNKWPMKIGILLSLTLAIVNVLVSFSRGAYLALSMLLIWIVVHFIFVRQIRKSFKYLFLTFVLASLATVPIFKYIVDSASIHGSVSQTRSVEGRLNIWSDALKISKVKPIIGIGAGNFALKYNSTRSCNATSIFTSRIANTPLQIYVERGIIGLVLYLFVYYYILAAFRKYPGYNTNDRDILLTALGGVLCLFIRDLSFANLLNYAPATFMFLFIIAIVSNVTERNELYAFRTKYSRKLFLAITLGCLGFGLYNTVMLHRKVQKKATLIDYVNQNGFDKTVKGLMAQDYLHKLDTQHFADMGLINERINSKRVEFSTLFEQGKYSSDSMWIATSISYYDSALSLGSADDLYYQNLGWLYLFKNKLPISSLYFHRSIAADCNNMEAFIGLGFLSEIHSDTLSASINYEKALLTNLDLISSPFCRDLKKRQPVLYENLLRNCIRDLNARLLIDTNPVDLGRLGAAYYHLGQWSDSETILRKVVKMLPNLNRPWYYLGLLQREKSINEAEALPFFQKAELLDPRDYLVGFELGRSYQRLGKERLAITYYKKAIKNYVEHRGRHFTKGLDMYNVLPFHDELIPFGLNEYTSPYLDIYKLSGVIADLSLAVGNHGDYKIFNKIMMKKARPTGEQIKAWNLL